jgi:RNA polymerase sigma-70 factor (ECF subfamily)
MNDLNPLPAATVYPPGEPSDRSLLVRLRAGSEEAAVVLYGRYARRLRELAQAQCSAELARQVEAEDIVQSVFRSFFSGASEGCYDLPDGEELWRLFLVIALNKIRARSRFHRAARRDVRRTVSGESFDVSLEAVAGRDESAAALLEITMHEALEQLSEDHRQAIRLRIEGHEVAEIAARIGRSKRSAERLLQEARQHLAIHLSPR